MRFPSRNISLDFIRSLAAFFVVLNHVTENIYTFTPEFVITMSEKAKWFAFSSYTLGRIGVPLFLLLTGYLVLSKTFTSDTIVQFYKHSLLPLFFVWEIWILIYCIFIAWFYHIPFDFVDYLCKALFLKHVGIAHAWYVPMILGMYLFLPFVSMALNQMHGKHLLFLLIIMYSFLFVIPSISVFQSALNIASSQFIYNILDLSFGGNGYGFYLILGYCLARWKNRVLPLWEKTWFHISLWISIIALFISTVYMQIVTFKIGVLISYGYVIWYNFFTVPLLSIALFIALSGIHYPQWLHKSLINLSSCSFGVYLLHELLLIPILNQLGDISDKSTFVLIWTFIIYFACVLMIQFISLFPFGDKLFLRKVKCVKEAEPFR